jgi:hypothetical protein
VCKIDRIEEIVDERNRQHRSELPELGRKGDVQIERITPKPAFTSVLL